MAGGIHLREKLREARETSEGRVWVQNQRSESSTRMQQQNSGKKIVSILDQCGEILSLLVEDMFDDEEDSEGTNATGIFSVKMRLGRHIPQFIPVDSRRIKIYNRTIRKLCTNCFQKHQPQDCTNCFQKHQPQNKVPWIDMSGRS